MVDPRITRAMNTDMPMILETKHPIGVKGLLSISLLLCISKDWSGLPIVAGMGMDDKTAILATRSYRPEGSPSIRASSHPDGSIFDS
jgi:hypothetical protein